MNEKQLSFLDLDDEFSDTISVQKTSNQKQDETIKNQTNLLVQLLSVIYEPVAITALLKCVKDLKIKQASGSQHTASSLKVELKKLEKKHTIKEQYNRYYLARSKVEKFSKDAVKEGIYKQISTIVQSNIPLTSGWNEPKPTSADQAIRELRISIYSGNEKQFYFALGWCEEVFYRNCSATDTMHNICFESFDPEWFSKLPLPILGQIIFSTFNKAIGDLDNIDALLDWLIVSHEDNTLQIVPELFHILSSLLLLKGEFNKAKKLIPYLDEYRQFMLQGWMSFVNGDNENAIVYFESSLKTLKKTTKKRRIFIEPLSGIFYILALIRRGKSADLILVADFVKIRHKSDKTTHKLIYEMFDLLLNFISGKKSSPFNRHSLPIWPQSISGVDYYFMLLILKWMNKEAAVGHYKYFTKYTAALKKGGYDWLLAETFELMSCLNKKEAKKNQKQALVIRESLGCKSIIDVVREKAEWERSLEAISNISAAIKSNSTKKESRIIWILDFDESNVFSISPKEQKQNAKGGWSAGRAVSLKRLSQDHESFKGLSPQDIKASNAIVQSHDYWGSEYEIDFERMLPSLVGHPNLFSSNKNATHIELIKGAPEVQVTQKGKHLIIKMFPEFDLDRNIAIVKESETRWKVIESTAEQRQIAELIGSSLKIPKEAKEQVLSSISAVAPFVDIHSDIGGGVTQAENVEADNTLHLLLSPMDEGLKVEARTQVFGSKGPYYHPGVGGKTIIAEVDGKQLQTTRNLKLEQNNIQTVLAQCPELSNIELHNDEWAIFEPETCLEVLVELKEQQNAIVSWPEGEKLKVKQTVSLSDFKMVIKKDNDWFSAKGELKLDDGQVLNMQRLIELIKGAKGRFLSLEDGQFIALTDTFKNRIAELQAFGEEKDGEIKLHPLAAIALDDMASEAGKLTSDKAWKTYISRFHEAMKLEPEVPSTLQAELRSYQKEGFQWLVRLAHWGVGACLADDMGLGKTVQAIALLLHRANVGPALVVAPTSVAMNWMDEIQRFSPTLNIIDYRESDRKTVLNDLNGFDVVICSYGLIQNNIEQIESVEWATTILDEAQAIKNSATKRSQAIMRLSSEVKIVMTGTPIENHLGELWNLFRFINPGLLGSMEKFNNRYANPIVRDESIDVRQKLKKLIHPYILRRTKTQVLKELPSRTEITLQVDMSKEEAALYEALRRDAVEKFADSDLPQGNRQLQILAEITRLRRACCNPSLVLKVGAPPSSKLALFAHVIEELLDNNHKVLVFSQFVDHLSILKEKLDSMKVNYQYLDGSTPAKQRKKRVNDFQSGEGDVFLISLKAGGVGLNLTAADYVIHMDPWWNPAVEDQASDRAHRIGQKRPVTVYRMITKNTIEEKIVAMHKGKRDLADNLLAGANVAGKVNVEELLSLLKEG